MARRQLIAFYAVALLLAIAAMAIGVAADAEALLGGLVRYLEETAQYPNVISIGRFALAQQPAALAIFLFAAAPTLAAIIVTTCSRSLSARALFARLRPIGEKRYGSSARQCYGWLSAAYLGGIALYLAIPAFFSPAETLSPALASARGPLLLLLAWFAVAPFLDEGGLLEELGWRGFALPLLQQLMATPLRAAVVLGCLWWAWHLPRELPALLGGIELSSFLALQGLFLLLCVAETITCVVAVNACGGSIIPAIIIHGGSNVWSKALGAPVYELLGFDLRTLLMVLAAGLLLLRFGPSLGRR